MDHIDPLELWDVYLDRLTTVSEPLECRQRSERVFLAEKKFSESSVRDGAARTSQVEEWLRHVYRLETQVDAHTALHGAPYTLLAKGVISTPALRSWVHRQSSREDTMCLYERLRLSSITGWHWDWDEARWDGSRLAFATFMTAHAKVPRKNSEDREETSLYYWRRGQCKKNKAGELSPKRVRALQETLGWAC